MNIRLAILDHDINYLERLSGVMQQYDDISVSVFSAMEYFQESSESNDFQIVLFNPDMSEQLLVFSTNAVLICLCSEDTKNKKMYASLLSIQKYQRISNIYKETIKIYAEHVKDSGIDYFKSVNTRMIAVYSPVGGCGKTTISLALAKKIQEIGKRVLFLSVEQYNSSSIYCRIQEEGITQLVEAVNGNSSFELKLKGILKQNDSGLLYIEGFSRLVDYDDVSSDEIEKVLDRIKMCDVCDYIIIDMESTLDPLNKAVLQKADKIVLIQRSGEMSDIKLAMFDNQVLANELKDHMCIVKNFATQNMREYEMKNVPIIGTVKYYGNIMYTDLLNCIEKENNIDIGKI